MYNTAHSTKASERGGRLSLHWKNLSTLKGTEALEKNVNVIFFKEIATICQVLPEMEEGEIAGRRRT